jgi:hypothetical protein
MTETQTERNYSVMYDFAFELPAAKPDGSDLTGAELRAALIKRLRAMDDTEITEACGVVDSVEIAHESRVLVQARAVMHQPMKLNKMFNQSEVDRGIAEHGSLNQWLRVDYPEYFDFTSDGADFDVSDAEVIHV